MGNPGKLFDLKDGRFGIAYNNEQAKEFGARVYVRLFADQNCFVKITDGAGNHKGCLKSIDKLKFIGFVD